MKATNLFLLKPIIIVIRVFLFLHMKFSIRFHIICSIIWNMFLYTELIVVLYSKVKTTPGKVINYVNCCAYIVTALIQVLTKLESVPKKALIGIYGHVKPKTHYKFLAKPRLIWYKTIIRLCKWALYIFWVFCSTWCLLILIKILSITIHNFLMDCHYQAFVDCVHKFHIGWCY